LASLPAFCNLLTAK